MRLVRRMHRCSYRLSGRRIRSGSDFPQKTYIFHPLALLHLFTVLNFATLKKKFIRVVAKIFLQEILYKLRA